MFPAPCAPFLDARMGVRDNPAFMWPDRQSLLALAPPSDGQAPNPLIQFIPLILVFGVFYFVVFAPMHPPSRSEEQFRLRKSLPVFLLRPWLEGEAMIVEEVAEEIALFFSAIEKRLETAVSNQAPSGSGTGEA